MTSLLQMSQAVLIMSNKVPMVLKDVIWDWSGSLNSRMNDESISWRLLCVRLKGSVSEVHLQQQQSQSYLDNNQLHWRHISTVVATATREADRFLHTEHSRPVLAQWTFVRDRHAERRHTHARHACLSIITDPRHTETSLTCAIHQRTALSAVATIESTWRSSYSEEKTRVRIL